MSEAPLKAEFFVTRDTGRMISLVAVDELPHHITIAGVSRIMSAFDIAGMTCVGRTNFRNRQHTVRDAPELATRNTTPSLDPLKAKYFITRDSGNMVPLVAMDEMPPEFVIEGVPPTLSVFDVMGMTCVGVSDARERVHTVQDINEDHISNKPESAYGTPELGPVSPVFEDLPEPVIVPSLINLGVSKPVVKTPPVVELPTEAPSTPRTLVDETFSTPRTVIPYRQNSANRFSTPATVNSTTRRFKNNFRNASSKLNTPMSAPSLNTSSSTSAKINTPLSSVGFDTPVTSPPTTTSTNTLVPGVKEYCSYWIRHGECDYQQQGCLYKHEMPLDQEALLRLGLRDIPRWYREKHSLGSFLAAGGSGAAFSGQGLMSAAASGIHENDKKNNMTRNWRNGAVPRQNHPPSLASPFGARRGNIYNPRANRVITDPSPFGRTPTVNTPVTIRGGKLRGSETPVGRQQHQSTRSLSAHVKMESIGRQQFSVAKKNVGNADISASPTHPPPPVRRESASTLYSDIEAAVHRQDTARRAKEDDEYNKVCELNVDKKKPAEKEVKRIAESKGLFDITVRGWCPGENHSAKKPNRRRTIRNTSAGENVVGKMNGAA